MTAPSYFHNAVIYSEEFFHLDPQVQGTFLAPCRDVIPQAAGSVGAASWALHWEMVRDRKGEESFGWFQEPMLYPISDPLRDYVEGQAYRQGVQQALQSNDVEIFQNAFRQMLQCRGIHLLEEKKIEAWIRDES